MGKFIAVDPTNCSGCKTCEMVCSMNYAGESNVWQSAIRVIRKEKDGLVFCLPLVCQQCDEPACVDVCPTAALSNDDRGAEVTFNKELCINCGQCVDACPAKCVPVNAQGDVVRYCDLCGGNPLCVLNCHAGSLTVADRKTANQNQNADYIAMVIRQQVLEDYVPGGGR